MQLVRDPEPDAALEFLRTEIQRLNEGRGRLVQAVADCEVKYQGRASSTLHRGERLLVLKPDGTLLVHTAAKAKPVNWQPPGAVFDCRLQGGAGGAGRSGKTSAPDSGKGAGADPDAGPGDPPRLVLTAYRRKPEELVHITFHTVHLLIAVPLRDDAELALVGSEADLQQLLFEHPEFVEDGFAPRRRERNSKRGFYDLDGDDAEGRRLIVEVKRSTAGVKEAQQLWRYVEKLRGRDGKQDGARQDPPAPTKGAKPEGKPDGKKGAGPDENRDRKKGGSKGAKDDATKVRVRGLLVAPRVAPKARALLADHDLEWKELDWADVLPAVEAMRHSGQVGLGRFG